MTYLKFVLISLIVWQIILGIYLLLLWTLKNFKFHKSPVLNIGESFKSGSPIKTSERKNIGPIEVDIQKNIKVDTADEQSVKLDEKIKGKVKTQKNKLRGLRR
tara:strand:- start:230 stop:538 length:309 start_codon:yes stop_codon:yes gene_type:complete